MMKKLFNKLFGYNPPYVKGSPFGTTTFPLDENPVKPEDDITCFKDEIKEFDWIELVKIRDIIEDYVKFTIDHLKESRNLSNSNLLDNNLTHKMEMLSALNNEIKNRLEESDE